MADGGDGFVGRLDIVDPRRGYRTHTGKTVGLRCSRVIWLRDGDR